MWLPWYSTLILWYFSSCNCTKSINFFSWCLVGTPCMLGYGTRLQCLTGPSTRVKIPTPPYHTHLWSFVGPIRWVVAECNGLITHQDYNVCPFNRVQTFLKWLLINSTDISDLSALLLFWNDICVVRYHCRDEDIKTGDCKMNCPYLFHNT